jgi:O-antigen ligase
MLPGGVMGDIGGLLGLGLGFFSVLGGFAVAFYAIWLKSKAREMRHREHMAMIEKGLVPPQQAESFAVGEFKPVRVRRESGIMMICIGIALMMFFGLSSGSWRNVWIGGFVLMFGVASLISALLDERDRRKTQPPAPQIPRSPDL